MLVMTKTSDSQLSDTQPHLHTSHPAIAKRLKRATGHLAHVIGMIETHAGCTDIAQQLYAVEKAIANAKRALIQDHIDHCLEHSLEADDEARAAALDDFKTIAKFL